MHHLLTSSANKWMFPCLNDNLTTVLRNFDVQNGTTIVLDEFLDYAPVQRGAVTPTREGPSHLWFLAPYSPSLNSVEKMFSVFKLKLWSCFEKTKSAIGFQIFRITFPLQSIDFARFSNYRPLSLKSQKHLVVSAPTDACSNVMRYMHRCLAMADISESLTFQVGKQMREIGC